VSRGESFIAISGLGLRQDQYLAEGAELVLLADLYPAKILHRDWGSIPPPSAILTPKPGAESPKRKKKYGTVQTQRVPRTYRC
jgi:hypothetical protein